MGNGFYSFFIRVTLIKVANTLLDRSAALVLSVINRTYCSCTGIWPIWLEIWPELDLAGFLKNGLIPDLQEPKSCTSLFLNVVISCCQVDCFEQWACMWSMV